MGSCSALAPVTQCLHVAPAAATVPLWYAVISTGGLLDIPGPYKLQYNSTIVAASHA